MTAPQEPVLRMDAGGSRYSLQAQDSEGLRLVRSLSDDEAEHLLASLRASRAYLGANPMRLLLIAAYRVQHEVRSIGSTGGTPPSVNNLTEAFVSWLLLFQMTLDQWAAEINHRYGKTSDRAGQYADATHTAYDDKLGYRVACGGRDRLAHHSLPPLHGRVHRRLDETDRPVTEVEVSLSASWFTDWDSCPANLKRDCRDRNNSDFDLASVVDEAMAGIEIVRPVAEDLIYPDLADHGNRVMQAAVDCQPGLPLVLKLDVDERGEIKPEFAPLGDVVLALIQARSSPEVE